MVDGNDGKLGIERNVESATCRLTEEVEGSNPTLTARYQKRCCWFLSPRCWCELRGSKVLIAKMVRETTYATSPPFQVASSRTSRRSFRCSAAVCSRNTSAALAVRAIRSMAWLTGGSAADCAAAIRSNGWPTRSTSAAWHKLVQ